MPRSIGTSSSPAPGCRNYVLGALDHTAVPSQRLDRVATLTQLVSLAQAGLSH
jgi:hypothetical protein